MHIYWYGLSSFKIVSKDVTVFTDVFGKSAGLTPARGSGQVVISSDADNEIYNNFSSISGDPFMITGPGEYDIKGVFVRGIPADPDGKDKKDKKTKIDRRAIYSITLEDITIALLSGFSGNTLSQSQIEDLGEPDILIVPVGDPNLLSVDAAVTIANQMEPHIIIPCQYKTPGIKLKLDAVDPFLKEIGDKGETIDKLLVKKNDFEAEKTRVVLLSPQR